jgi:hypothetical protein
MATYMRPKSFESCEPGTGEEPSLLDLSSAFKVDEYPKFGLGKSREWWAMDIRRVCQLTSIKSFRVDLLVQGEEEWQSCVPTNSLNWSC